MVPVVGYNIFNSIFLITLMFLLAFIVLIVLIVPIALITLPFLLTSFIIFLIYITLYIRVLFSGKLGPLELSYLLKSAI